MKKTYPESSTDATQPSGSCDETGGAYASDAEPLVRSFDLSSDCKAACAAEHDGRMHDVRQSPTPSIGLRDVNFHVS